MTETGRPASIFIVEDERVTARDLKFTLEDLGYIVPGTADSGESAVEQVSADKPDLVLMDIHLKGKLDGIETAQLIADRYEIPVVYLTAHFDQESLERAKRTFPLGYIIKPFERRELGTTIEVALYKHELDKVTKKHALWLSTLLDGMGDGVIATDVDGHITLLNPAAEKLTSWSAAEAIGLSANKIFKIINENSRKPVASPIDKVLETHIKQYLPDSTLLISRDGVETPIEDSAAPIFYSKSIDENEPKNNLIMGSVLIFKDVTHKKNTAKKLTRQAFYDSLTNLPNRAWFRERLIDALERTNRQPEGSFAVLLLDLDHFKSVNDGMGHNIGDRLLIAVGERVGAACRSIDTVARLGGDEFIVLLENIHGEDEVDSIVQRIQFEISAPYNFNGQEVFATSSMGVVLCSPDHDTYSTIDDLIRDADIAMYHAKASGRGCYQFFDREMRQKVVITSQIEGDLHRVIERDELSVYYQPIFCLTTGKINGFEALSRWKHPTKGFIPPSDFFPIADDIGIGVKIDRLIFEAAMQQILSWQEKYPHLSQLKLNLNLSCKHFTQAEPLKWVEQGLKKYSFPPKQLNLEITENLLIENTKLAISVLKEMKSLGTLISIDDFGTGYCSLRYLQQFPIDTLKIDRSFIEGIGHQDQDSLEIVRAIISLGQVLNIETVAEGIETREQLETLKQLKCDSGQGFYFSKAMAAEDIEVLLQESIR